MYANGRNITMQREASMKESTFIFPAQNNNGPIYVCMYIDILMTYFWKLYTRKEHLYVKVSTSCIPFFFLMLCNVHTQ